MFKTKRQKRIKQLFKSLKKMNLPIDLGSTAYKQFMEGKEKVEIKFFDSFLNDGNYSLKDLEQTLEWDSSIFKGETYREKMLIYKCRQLMEKVSPMLMVYDGWLDILEENYELKPNDDDHVLSTVYPELALKQAYSTIYVQIKRDLKDVADKLDFEGELCNDDLRERLFSEIRDKYSNSIYIASLLIEKSHDDCFFGASNAPEQFGNVSFSRHIPFLQAYKEVLEGCGFDLTPIHFTKEWKRKHGELC